jgi:hypothetical protein
MHAKISDGLFLGVVMKRLSVVAFLLLFAFCHADDVDQFVERLKKEHVISTRGDDAVNRPLFVGAQGVIEREIAYARANGQVEHLGGAIFTPTPATPLCTEGEISAGLLHGSITDLDRAITVMNRASIMRYFLHSGGHLYVVYPQSGWNKRSSEQQNVFAAVAKKFPTHLHNCPWNDVVPGDDLVAGAIYFFSFKEGGELGVFSIQAPQANAPSDEAVWSIWYGPYSDSRIRSRVDAVLDCYGHNGELDKLSTLVSWFKK